MPFETAFLNTDRKKTPSSFQKLKLHVLSTGQKQLQAARALGRKKEQPQNSLWTDFGTLWNKRLWSSKGSGTNTRPQDIQLLVTTDLFLLLMQRRKVYFSINQSSLLFSTFFPHIPEGTPMFLPTKQPNVCFQAPPSCLPCQHSRSINLPWHCKLGGSACLSLVWQLSERWVTDCHLDDVFLNCQAIHFQHSLRGLGFVFKFHIGQALNKDKCNPC